MRRLTGADASHAWVSVFCGEEAGWIDTDPTNNLLPGERHITVAWGRDFSDVSPLRGVTLGAGGQRLAVAVDVIPDVVATVGNVTADLALADRVSAGQPQS
jgi:transglutaminase-like putative cysteine protease